MRRHRYATDPYADEPLGGVRHDTLPIRTDDGVDLHVEVGGPAEAPVTVVLSHGWTQSVDFWHFQRRDLSPDMRVVAYDQRGHGRSAHGESSARTVDRLGLDLAHVVEHALETAPTGGRILVAGHSMGGLSTMSMARQRPDLLGRLGGIALMSTFGRSTRHATLGLRGRAGSYVDPLSTKFSLWVKANSEKVASRHRPGRAPVLAFTRRFVVGPTAPESLVRFVEHMISSTDLGVVADFSLAMKATDELGGVAALGRVPTHVVVGSHDRLTPVLESRLLADAIPGSRLVVVPGAGHMAPLEQPHAVTMVLRTLASQAQSSLPHPA